MSVSPEQLTRLYTREHRILTQLGQRLLEVEAATKQGSAAWLRPYYDVFAQSYTIAKKRLAEMETLVAAAQQQPVENLPVQAQSEYDMRARMHHMQPPSDAFAAATMARLEQANETVFRAHDLKPKDIQVIETLLEGVDTTELQDEHAGGFSWPWLLGSAGAGAAAGYFTRRWLDSRKGGA